MRVAIHRHSARCGILSLGSALEPKLNAMAAKLVWRGEGILAFTLAMTLITAGCRATKPPITQHAAQTALHSRALAATPDGTSQPNSALPQEQMHAAVVPTQTIAQTIAQPQSTGAVSQRLASRLLSRLAK